MADTVEDSRKQSARKRSSHSAANTEGTPTKRRRISSSLDAEAFSGIEHGTKVNGDDSPQETPTTTPRRRGRPPKPQSQTSTPSKTPSNSIFATPIKDRETNLTTPRRQAADRSARKKSARILIETVIGNGDSDDEDDDNEVLVRQIYDDSEADDRQGSHDDGDTNPPTSRKQKARGTRTRSPTPPRHLPPHELYFAHNKPGRPKTSDNTLSSLSLLTHDEYFTLLGEQTSRYSDDVAYLEGLHAELFPQWTFELSQGFSICLYGFGSKRTLLSNFVKHYSRRAVVVNGYAPTTSLREVLTRIGEAFDPALKLPTSSPASMAASILSQASTLHTSLTLLINSMDAPPLRKPSTQAILAQLAAHPSINLICSVDTPDFSLLWDIGIRSSFNFVFHDCTTFAPLTVELDVVDEVHELLNRKARRVNGREGVAFVLKSLPENAKNLFRLLVSEVLVAMEEEGSLFDEAPGVEYRIMYNKAVEEFICTSEMAFRTLLKEFHDHQMITSHKDALGTELLSVPFQKDELEAILEDLLS